MDKLNLFSLEGKKAIITGGQKGMGYMVAKYFADYGAEVCIIDMNPDTGDTARELAQQTGGKVHAVVGELSNSQTRKKAFEEAISVLNNQLDILVNNAGIQILADAIDYPYEAYRKVMNINLDAVFELSQMAARVMLPQKSGKIINFASMTSFISGLRVPAYTASKGGVMQLTKSFSNEWAGQGIQVNAIAPGYIWTKMNEEFFSDKEASWRIFRRIAMGRWGQPEDIASVVLFLASRASDYMSGVTVPVDGGFLAME
ncbi:MAG: glucose 1-dehydrogenase [Suipraeoptans sp.]